MFGNRTLSFGYQQKSFSSRIYGNSSRLLNHPISSNSSFLSSYEQKQSPNYTEPNNDKSKIFGSKVYPKWSIDEKKALIEAQKQHGSKWKLIAEKYLLVRKPRSLGYQWSMLKDSGAINNDSYFETPKWTPEEDTELKLAVKKYDGGPVNWNEIFSTGKFPHKSGYSLRGHYRIVLAKSRRGRWTNEEDEKLIKLVEKHGRKWTQISDVLERPCNQIYWRYTNCLAPGIKRGPWTIEENQNLAKVLEECGQDWDEMMRMLPRRTLGSIKSYVRYSPRFQKNCNMGPWNQDEIQALYKAMKEHGENWEKLSKAVGTRNPTQCNKKVSATKKDLIYFEETSKI
ncbi:hypothetical protein G9A89_007196 [Geosiphon pyriformis]|nr:hypothetical protein G9A89_007196 [Geosiphon pyriformis]